ncbi:MAG TPA: LarC family nickel insertion protein, partial [Tessaracoccus flavescens]|nr:LarC family nickel insertion protein [Tessaracoccus flavescens]
IAEAVRTLGIADASSSVVAVGTGTVRTQHGELTVPPPAVIELAKGWQIEAGGPAEAGELCTPTGMAAIVTLCDEVGPLPTMRVDAVGTGAGSRMRKDRAGVLRVVVGTRATTHDASAAGQPGAPATPSEVHQISANVDDLDPRLWPAVLDRVLDAGAVDAWLTPIVMKKGRPAHTISALAPNDAVGAVADALIAHTSTIGVRVSPPWSRRVLQRTWRTVNVEGHDVRIKISGDGPGSTIQQATAEFSDVEALAQHLQVSQRVALSEAMSAAWQAGLAAGAPWPEGV